MGPSSNRDGGVIGKPGYAARIGILLIQAYRLTFSAMLGRHCRHLPTCSEYAIEALRQHGLWAGLFMTVARICRCGPFGSHGYDPVPATLRADARWWCPWRYGVWRLAQSDDKLAIHHRPK